MNTMPVKAYNGLSVEDLRQQLLVETDITNVNEIVRQLKAHIDKKDIIRKSELADLQDKIQEQMTKRVVEKGSCFSNKDLLEYYRAIEASLHNADEQDSTKPTALPGPEPRPIQIDDPTLSREEKMQVVDAVKAIIDRLQKEQLEKNIIEGDYKEINEQ